MSYTFKHGDRPLEGLTVQRAVGRGGFGEVYYAVTDSGKQVALKYLRENPEVELRGVAHVMNLKSPHLITIYDVKRNAAGEPFVIMEYVAGPSLRELMIAEPAGTNTQKTAFFLKGICRGLSYLHERGIVHRDLKPANIFYDDGYVKIGDYGLSKHMSVSKHSGQTVSVGTVHYMAPEIGSGSYTQAIDIYALGVILYEMLTGRLPYTGSSMAEILMRHVRDEPDLSGIPAPFAPVISKALAKDPAARYQNADEMLAAVMDSADVSQSVAAFDASALSQVPRVAEATDPDRTVTATPHVPPVPPPLDVRQPTPRGELPERLQRKLDGFSRKLEQKVSKLERKFGGQRWHWAARPHGGRGGPRPRRWGHIFILFAVTVGISIVLGALVPGRNDPPAAICVALYILGGTIGPLLMHLRLLQRSLTRNPLLDRLACASMAGLFMLPAYGLASEEFGRTGLPEVIFGPLAMLLLCDWGRRIEDGRRGRVNGWDAFWPAVIGLIAAAIADAEESSIVAAGICAAICLMTQSAAVMWPTRRSSSAEPGILGAHHSPLAGAAPARETSPEHRGATDVDAAPEAEAATASSPPLVQVETVQPSFVGRSANAGVVFLGKMFLLVGVALAVAQGPAHDAWRTGALSVDSDLTWLVRDAVPPGFVLLALLLGSLLLVLGRRRDGTTHFLRGCLGCVLLLFGSVLATMVAHEPLMVLISGQDADVLSQPDMGGRLLGAGIPLILGVFFLLWPKPQRDTIVI